MKLISDYITEQTNSIFVGAKTKPRELGEPLGGTKDGLGVVRIKRNELEQCYLSDNIVFNALNKTVAVQMSVKENFLGDPNSVNFYEEFYNRIGETGGETDRALLRRRTYFDQWLYGEHYTELIGNKQATKIVDLDVLDPKKMDYVKTTDNRILTDSQGRPKGFVLTKQSLDPVKNKFKFPERAIAMPNQIFFPPGFISHFKLYTLGEGLQGLGIVEPMYLNTKHKLNIEKASANSYLLRGFPIPYATVGEKDFEPTEQHLTNALEQLVNLDNKSALVFPWHTQVKFLEAGGFEKVKEQLDYFREGQTTASGMPEAFITGKGDLNRAIIGRLEYFFKLSLKELMEQTARTRERTQINRIAALEKGINPIKIQVGELSLEEMDSKAKRLMMYAQNGLLTPDIDLEKYLRMLEGLPEKKVMEKTDKEATKIIKEKKQNEN